MIRRAAALVALSLFGCTAARPPAGPPSAPGRQTLYRVQYESGDDKGSFRVLLKRPRVDGQDERFDLSASDPLGRILWALQVVDGEGTWFDFRDRRVCEIGGSFRLAALHLPELPLAALPRILAGEPPDSGERADAGGRTWTLVRDAQGRLTGWRLAEGGKETVRCELDPLDGGGTLHTDSSRLRFRPVATEPLAAAPPPRQPPAGFAHGGCEALALP